MGQARYYSTDPRRASVSGYAGTSDPLVRPDYTGAAPIRPGASTAVDAAVAHHAEASGENLAQLATTSEASLEGSSRTGSTVAASPVTVSTHQNPSPFAQRYLSYDSFRNDQVGALARDDSLRDWVGRDPIDSVNVSVSDSPDGDQEARRSLIPRRSAPNGHQPLVMRTGQQAAADHLVSGHISDHAYAIVPPMPVFESEAEMAVFDFENEVF